MLGREENTMKDSGTGFGSGERRASEICFARLDCDSIRSPRGD